MADKSRARNDERPVLAVFDEATMREVMRLAAFYGVNVEEVITELLRLDLETRPEGATLH